MSILVDFEIRWPTVLAMVSSPPMLSGSIKRREFLRTSVVGLSSLPIIATAQATSFRLATFSAEVTPPLGAPLFAVKPVIKIADALFARGFVLTGGGPPVVFCSVDWIEIRNDAYERWREALARAAGTTPERVLVTAVHQHDAPLADLEARRITERHQAAPGVIDLEFHEACVQRVATALKDAWARSRPVTHFGTGQARVDKVASNRRIVRPDGTVDHGRGSAGGGNAAYREAPEGTIDPWLKSLSFWDGNQPLMVLSSYATHPMSYYGGGEVSADFPGLARARRQQDDPPVFQIYASGCSGNVTAGKYNDGSRGNREALTERLHQGMATAWEATKKYPLTQVGFRSSALHLKARQGDGFAPEAMTRVLGGKTATPFTAMEKCRAALGLSWHQRVAAGQAIDVPVLDLGPAQLLLLPAEAYVEYQLFAQSLRPDSFVLTVGYGECGPGYIPTERAWEEQDSNLRDWCWVTPGAEAQMKRAIQEALTGP